MSELTNLIFKNEPHRLSSPFGSRAVIKTAKGKTASFHNGADYSTFGKKLSQYAVCDGEVVSCGIDRLYADAKFVWVSYPALGVRMLHYHLDDICVKSGQKVNEKTVLGHTGQTGFATGIHLHLGIKRIGQNAYIDPEKWSKEEFELIKKAYVPEIYIVTADVLNVRKAPGTKSPKLGFSDLTSNAQKQILSLCGKRVNGYVKGVEISVGEICGNWGKTPSGWVCLDFCEVIK